MADDYIKRSDAIHALCNVRSLNRLGDLQEATSAMNVIPSADVRPVVHAEWDADGKCTACGQRWDEHMHDNGDDWGYFDPMPPFCLNCGATMDADMREEVGS